MDLETLYYYLISIIILFNRIVLVGPDLEREMKRQTESSLQNGLNVTVPRRSKRCSVALRSPAANLDQMILRGPGRPMTKAESNSLS